MRNLLFGAGTMLLAAATQPGGPPQCWTAGVAVPCPAPPAAGNTPAPPLYTPTRRQYPPSWYYDPYDKPWFHCKLGCGP